MDTLTEIERLAKTRMVAWENWLLLKKTVHRRRALDELIRTDARYHDAQRAEMERYARELSEE